MRRTLPSPWSIATFVVVLVLGILPLALVVRQALLEPHTLRRVLGSGWAWVAARNTVVLALGTTALAVAIGMPLAWLTTRTDLPTRRALHPLLTIPYVVPPYIAAVAWINLANPRVGLLNALLGEGTLDIYGMGGLTWVMGLSFYPYVFLTVRSALENADPSLEDAARMSGAGTWRLFRDVSLPLMRPALLTSGILVFLVTASAFGAPVLIGGPAKLDFLSTRIFESLSSGLGGTAEAASLSCLLLAFVLLPMAVRARSHAVVTGKPARPTRVGLGRAGPVVALLLWLFAALAILLPAFAVAITAFLKVAGDYRISNLTLGNFALLERTHAGEAIRTSLFLAVAAATAACLLGGSIAYVQVVTRRVGGRLLAALAALPLAAPGTVLALGLILLWTRPFGMAFSLASTAWVLGIAYVAKYLSLAQRALAEGFGSIDAVLPEAARMSGARPFFLVRTIWFPLLAPALAAGWFLVFMPAFSELTMSILLVRPGLETVGTKMFELQEYEGPAAASVLATVVLAFVVASNVLLRVGSKGRYGI